MSAWVIVLFSIPFFVWIAISSKEDIIKAASKKQIGSLIGMILLFAFGGGMLGFVSYLAVGVGINTFAEKTYQLHGTYKLYSIYDDHHTEEGYSGKIHTNIDVNQYVYGINENGGVTRYFAPYNDSTVKLTTGEEKVEIKDYKFTNGFLEKYFFEVYLTNTKETTYTFYLNKETAENNLGIDLESLPTNN